MPAVYLDDNATTSVDPDVLAAMLPFFTDQFGNASSAHAFGTIVSPAIREARRAVSDLLGAALDQEIIFTSGGTEADNTAIVSALENHVGRDEVVVSAVGHPAPAEFVCSSRTLSWRRREADSGGLQRLSRYGRLSGCPWARHSYCFDDVGQQRNRHAVPGDRTGCARP
jgi:cysteine desulfurase